MECGWDAENGFQRTKSSTISNRSKMGSTKVAIDAHWQVIYALSIGQSKRPWGGHYALCFKTYASFGAQHENLSEDRPIIEKTLTRDGPFPIGGPLDPSLYL